MSKRPRPEEQEGEEQELEIDETAQDACDLCDFRVRQWPHPLPVLNLYDDCIALHAAHPEENFYLSWRAAQRLLAAATRPALLGYVAELCEFWLDSIEPTATASGYRLDRARCGAEFWVQRRAAGEDITFHWDKDEALREACDILIHPAVSTITYLTDGGAPTVLLEVRATAEEGQISSGAELVVGRRRKSIEPGGAPITAAAVVSYPRAGKLLAFSGGLLHGVPSSLAEGGGDSSAERLTLLVNVWVHHRPLGLCPLPRSFRSRLAAVSRGRVLSAAAAAGVEQRLATVTVGAHERQPPSVPLPEVATVLRELKLSVCGDGLLTVCLPDARRLVDSRSDGAGAIGCDGSLQCFGVPYYVQ